MAEQRVELSKLDAKMTEGPLTEEETLERAKLLKTVHGEIAALEWLQSESPKFPDQLVMRFMLGSLLLDEDHEEGVEILEEVGKKEPEVMDLACESIYNFYKRAGRHAEAREILLRADSHGEVSAKAQEERSIHKKTDKFMANDLSSEDLDALLAKLESEPTILKAWLLRKEVEHFAEKKAYLLVVKIKTRGFSNDQLEADLKSIQLILPALSTLKISFTVSGIDSCSVHLRTATKKVSGALIFERKKAKK
jgi:hypothetical protein